MPTSNGVQSLASDRLPQFFRKCSTSFSKVFSNNKNNQRKIKATKNNNKNNNNEQRTTTMTQQTCDFLVAI
jgi:hypothetical protein